MVKSRALVYGAVLMILNQVLVYGSEHKLDLSLHVISKPPYYQGQSLTYQSLVKHISNSDKRAENVTIDWVLSSAISYSTYQSQASARSPSEITQNTNQIKMKFGSLSPSEEINIFINVTVDAGHTMRDNRFHHTTISATLKHRWSDLCSTEEISSKALHFPFFSPECDSFGALGLKTGNIKDSQIQASTFQFYPPNLKTWVPMTSFRHLYIKRQMKLNFYQIDLKFSRELLMVSIDGVPKLDPIPWKIVQLSVSDNAWKWKMLSNIYVTEIFPSNADTAMVAIALLKPIKTRYLRINIPPFGLSDIGSKVYNMGLYACNFNNSSITEEDPSPVGIESSSLIPDSRFSSPSILNSQYQPHFGRLNTKVAGGSWCASGCSPLQYLQIDLGDTWRISEIESQGRHSTNGIVIAVKTYSLSSSRDGASWAPYKTNGGTKVFWGNDISNLATRHKLSKPITAKYVRFEPRACIGNACMRVELYGNKFNATETKDLPVVFGRSMLVNKANNTTYVCVSEVKNDSPHCFVSKDRGNTWKALSPQVLNVLAFDPNEQRLYGLSKNGRAYLKSKDPDGLQWYGISQQHWFSVRDRGSVYTAVEIPFVPISRNETNVIEPLVQLTAFNGDKWQADQVGVYFQPSEGEIKMVLSFLPYAYDLSRNPCHNGICVFGRCEFLGGSRYNCHCMPGYTGAFCDKIIDYCVSTPCQHNAICTPLVNDFKCTCTANYYGTLCQDYNECMSSPCLNGGTCVDGHNNFTCTCAPNYSGKTCQEFDDCTSSPCLYGGNCTDGGPSYDCSCLAGYSGTNCQVTPCSSSPCLNGGNCRHPNGGGYLCSCTIQYSGPRCGNGPLLAKRGSFSSSVSWSHSSGKFDKIVFYSDTNLTVFGVSLSETFVYSGSCSFESRIRKEGSTVVLASRSGSVSCKRSDGYLNFPPFASPYQMIAGTRYIIEVRMTSTKSFRKVINGVPSQTISLPDGSLSVTCNYETVDAAELADSNGSTQSEGGIYAIYAQIVHD